MNFACPKDNNLNLSHHLMAYSVESLSTPVNNYLGRLGQLMYAYLFPCLSGDRSWHHSEQCPCGVNHLRKEKVSISV